MSEEEQHYVYDQIEVKKTGRTAHKKIEGRGRAPSRLQILFEITPADNEDGSWKKWVKEADLFQIKQ